VLIFGQVKQKSAGNIVKQKITEFEEGKGSDFVITGKLVRISESDCIMNEAIIILYMLKKNLNISFNTSKSY